MPQCDVEAEILTKLPGLRVLIARLPTLDLDLIDKEGCAALLKESWNGTRERLSPLPNAHSHPHVAAWRTAYTSLGVPIKKYTTSIENLAKRTLKPDSQPRSICPLVDFYNAISLKTLLPFGGFDLEDAAVECMSLRFTRPGDSFHPLDGERSSVPEGEAAYCSGNVVLTRHINWKQSKEGLIENETKDVVFMAEVLGGIGDNVVEELKQILTAECERLLKVSPQLHIISESNPSVEY